MSKGKEKRHISGYELAYGALFVALSILFLASTQLFTPLDILFYLACSFLIAVMRLRFSLRASVLVLLSTCIIAFIWPGSYLIWPYYLLYGPYPLLKLWLEEKSLRSSVKKAKAICWLGKTIYFVLVFIVALLGVFGMIFFFSFSLMAIFDEFNAAVPLILAVLLNFSITYFTFLLYDFCLGLLLQIYKRLSKYF